MLWIEQIYNVLITCFHEYWIYESWIVYLLLFFFLKKPSVISASSNEYPFRKNHARQTTNFAEEIRDLYIQDSWTHELDTNLQFIYLKGYTATGQQNITSYFVYDQQLKQKSTKNYKVQLQIANCMRIF